MVLDPFEIGLVDLCMEPERAALCPCAGDPGPCSRNGWNCWVSLPTGGVGFAYATSDSSARSVSPVVHGRPRWRRLYRAPAGAERLPHPDGVLRAEAGPRGADSRRGDRGAEDLSVRHRSDPA